MGDQLCPGSAHSAKRVSETTGPQLPKTRLLGSSQLHRGYDFSECDSPAEDKKMQRQRLFTASSLLIVASMVANAQSAPRSDEVTGMSGTVKVLPNAKVGQTTVVFTSNTPLSSNSNQIVFVLQERIPLYLLRGQAKHECSQEMDSSQSLLMPHPDKTGSSCSLIGCSA